MNAKEIENLIKDSIKSEKLQRYLLSCLENESKLNSLSRHSFLIEKATKNLKNKIKICQKIEEDLPNEFILPGDSLLLTEKLEALRLNLSILYANKIYELTEDDYNEIKTFIYKILNFHNIHLKLKVFDLTKKLLERTTEFLKFNKDFIAVLDLLKLFINDPYSFKSEHLQNINNLSEKEIKKDFYGIVYELNKKLVFHDLLNQLLLIIRSSDKSFLMQFNLKFITNCIQDQTIDADDCRQLLTLVFQSLKCYELVSKNGVSNIRNNILSLKSLTDYLLEFEKEFEERLPKIKLELEKSLPKLTTDESQESDIKIYFPASIKNKKLMIKFYETKSQILEKSINPYNSFMQYLTNGLEKISTTANQVKINAKAVAVDIGGNLKEFTGTNTERLKELITKKSENCSLEENGEIAENNLKLKDSLIKAQTELCTIKERLDIWNSLLLNYHIERHTNNKASRDLDPKPEFLLTTVIDLHATIDKKFNELTRKILDEFENTNATIKRKGYWLEKSPINKPSFVEKLQRGYFNIDFSIKKIQAKLGDAPSFCEITDFISQRGLWTLLFDFGIVCWPWMNKSAFAHSWAEQLCLPEIINETKELKNLGDKEEFLVKIIILSKGFFLYKNQAIVQILKDFKSSIVITYGILESINQKIEKSLNECNYVSPLSSPINGLFGKISSQSKVNLMTDSTLTLSA